MKNIAFIGCVHLTFTVVLKFLNDFIQFLFVLFSLPLKRVVKVYPEMPLFRKLPEIRKFEIERKNFRKNETVSLEKKLIDQKGGKGLFSLPLKRVVKVYPEMPLFRKLPEIRKFEIERKNFRKNETVSLEKKLIDQKGGKGLEKRKMYQNSLIKATR